MNPSINYINSIPEARYEVIDPGLDDNFLNRNKGTLANALANILDRFASDRKGQLFTTGINVAGYAKNPEALVDHYNENAEVIDTYFSYVDLHALADAIGGDMEQKLITGSVEWLKRQVPAFLTGAGILAVILYLRKRRN